MNKATQSLLFSLFGPNGQDGMVHTGQKSQYKAAEELESLGLVMLVPCNDREGVYAIHRRQFQLANLRNSQK